MNEILPGIWHWSTFHEGIEQDVHSAFLAGADPPVLIDPMEPEAGTSWFEGREPGHVYLTNRHHHRHSDRFVEAFGCRVWCHEDGLHEFEGGPDVEGFRHGDELPGGLKAVEVGVICPEETALYVPRHGGVLAVADAVIRYAGELGFVPDFLLGDDPLAVKRGLREVLRGLVEKVEFDHMLFAHGAPWIGGAREGLRSWLDSLDF